MKFLLRRASVWHEGQPCEDVKEEKYNHIEWRTVSEEEFDRKFAPSEGLWRSKGINHTVNKQGYIGRTHLNSQSGYFLEFNTLEDLIKFIDIHGQIVIIPPNDSDYYTVEIYDDYRE